MSRYVGPVCRLCRREGRKLYLKGERCESNKCAIKNRNTPPGQHGLARIKISPYGTQLREKQKAKRTYGVWEKQFRRFFGIAEKYRGVTGTNLMQILERRLDNIVFRLGFAPSRKGARQMIVHGHVRLDGKKVDIPSYLVKVGQEVTVRDKMREHPALTRSIEVADRKGRLPWLNYSGETKSGKIATIPSRQDIPEEIDEQLIVELYSK